MFPYTFCLLINTKGGYFGLSFIFIFFKKLKKISHLFISQMIVQFCYLRVHLGIELFALVRCNGWQGWTRIAQPSSFNATLAKIAKKIVMVSAPG